MIEGVEFCRCFDQTPRRAITAAFLLLRSHHHWQNAPVGITPRQFEEMRGRLDGASPRRAAPVLETTLRAPANSHCVILGLDPSLRGTGYGVIRLAKPHPVALAQGTIACPPAWPHSRCLVRIVETLRDVLRQHHPTVCAVEGLFYAQNLQTAIVMGEARGPYSQPENK